MKARPSYVISLKAPRGLIITCTKYYPDFSFTFLSRPKIFSASVCMLMD